MTKTKFTAFLVMGAISVGLMSHLHQEIQITNHDKELKGIEICEQIKDSSIKYIQSPSFQTKESLNTMSGMTAATRQDMKKNELSSLSPEKVNCNIAEVRNKFSTNIKKLNQKNSGNISMTTPG